jgi:hypothetical protein
MPTNPGQILSHSSALLSPRPPPLPPTPNLFPNYLLSYACKQLVVMLGEHGLTLSTAPVAFFPPVRSCSPCRPGTSAVAPRHYRCRTRWLQPPARPCRSGCCCCHVQWSGNDGTDGCHRRFRRGRFDHRPRSLVDVVWRLVGAQPRAGRGAVGTAGADEPVLISCSGELCCSGER